MYQIKSCVRYSECGSDNHLKLASLINYFQDCTTENSEQLGVGHTFLRQRKRAWILNAWQIFIRRLPKVGEEVKVSTWATGFKGVLGPRDFLLQTAEGEELARAHSLWVYVDTENGRPVKPEKQDISAYQVEEALPTDGFSRKIKLPDSALEVDTFPVRKYHIDTNNHVNNSKYLEFACEVLPEDFHVTGIRVEYRKAAVYGDFITLKYEMGEAQVLVGLCDQEGNPYAMVEFMGEIK